MLVSKSLAAFAAVLRHGSFEAAVHEFSVTPSAISKRIKGLEELLGAVFVLRATPCTGTQVGARWH
ncbi:MULTISPECIES: LysR family transcriptional regulator [Falsihalocynthiibacter]|uniref:LysR family transcriptional regulator n=1 Tax=Falsihalocynthiibacter TaxID=2854182 RepID=UPI003001C4BC